MEGRRSNERGRASLFAQLKNLNNVNFHSISRRAGGQRKKTDWQPNCIRTTCRRQYIAEGERLLKQLAEASSLPFLRPSKGNALAALA